MTYKERLDALTEYARNALSGFVGKSPDDEDAEKVVYEKPFAFALYQPIDKIKAPSVTLCPESSIEEDGNGQMEITFGVIAYDPGTRNLLPTHMESPDGDGWQQVATMIDLLAEAIRVRPYAADGRFLGKLEVGFYDMGTRDTRPYYPGFLRAVFAFRKDQLDIEQLLEE